MKSIHELAAINVSSGKSSCVCFALFCTLYYFPKRHFYYGKFWALLPEESNLWLSCSKPILSEKTNIGWISAKAVGNLSLSLLLWVINIWCPHPRFFVVAVLFRHLKDQTVVFWQSGHFFRRQNTMLQGLQNKTVPTHLQKTKINQ